MGERGLVWFMYRLPGLIVDAHIVTRIPKASAISLPP
jgi:hypothetical protein